MQTSINHAGSPEHQSRANQPPANDDLRYQPSATAGSQGFPVSRLTSKTEAGMVNLLESRSGTIYPPAPPDRDDIHAQLLARQQRNLEWLALKEWWRARRMLQRAERRPNQRGLLAAQRGLQRVQEVYGDALLRAWPKWQRAQQELRARGYQQLG